MTLIKKIKDKKVNFEFNKEYIKVVTDKISNNDAQFITNSFKEMHPADAADIIEQLSENYRENLIKLNNFKIDPEVFIELNESVQTEIIKYLSSDAIVRILKNLESPEDTLYFAAQHFISHQEISQKLLSLESLDEQFDLIIKMLDGK